MVTSHGLAAGLALAAGLLGGLAGLTLAIAYGS
jgi:hypothetical protein